jgi:hypothetical protein
MKEETPAIRHGDYPPCSLSAHCARLLDDLDAGETRDDARLFGENGADREDREDRRLLEQLRTHVPTCSLCTATLAQERATRSRQRQMLRQVLAESERAVPSTTARILQALTREEQELQSVPAGSNGHAALEEIGVLSRPPLPARPKQRGTLLRNALALVAVLAVILGSMSLFSRMLPLRLAAGSALIGATGKQKTTRTPFLFASTWSSVVMATLHNGQKLITSTDPISGKSAMLASSRYPMDTAIDGVSHDGYKVLYRVFDGSRTRYYVRPSSRDDALYTLNGKGSQAIWSTDDHSIFISTPEGVEKVDVNSRAAMLALSLLQVPDLRFYRDGYLYFVQGENSGIATILSRVNLADGNVVPITLGLCALSYGFWLSPGGTTVYYRCKGHPDLYAVDSDGTHAHSLRLHSGDAIGYAGQGELLTLLKAGATYQVMQLGSDARHDQVVFPDVAPGAALITADNVAVMPYGRSLVALAHYADGSSKIWYDDLVANTQHAVVTYRDAQSAASVQFGGWSKLQVS